MMKSWLLLLLIAFTSVLIAQPCFPDSSIRVVVLGSSTAAGVGASIADSAWVNRYRAYLQVINPNNEVVNLGMSATTTFQIMPHGFVPPAGRPYPDTAHNITKAIELNADVIIVNMPSNDAFFGIDAATQMNNFKAIAAEADSAGIPIWIGTTQPRNLFPSQIQTQLSVRDFIFSYFGNNAIDFWTTIAGTDNLPNPIYDSGDGIHLNDAGHALLFERVIQENIPTQIMDTCVATDIGNYLKKKIRAYPNPNNGSFTIALGNNGSFGEIDISLVELSGSAVYDFTITDKSSRIILPTSIPPGTYLLYAKHPMLAFKIIIVVIK